MAEESDVSRAVEQQRTSRKEFDAAHQEGMAALKRHDYADLSEAVRRESEAIEKHVQAVDALNSVLRQTVADGDSRKEKRRRQSITRA